MFNGDAQDLTTHISEDLFVFQVELGFSSQNDLKISPKPRMLILMGLPDRVIQLDPKHSHSQSVYYFKKYKPSIEVS